MIVLISIFITTNENLQDRNYSNDNLITTLGTHNDFKLDVYLVGRIKICAIFKFNCNLSIHACCRTATTSPPALAVCDAFLLAPGGGGGSRE